MKNLDNFKNKFVFQDEKILEFLSNFQDDFRVIYFCIYFLLKQIELHRATNYVFVY